MNINIINSTNILLLGSRTFSLTGCPTLAPISLITESVVDEQVLELVQKKQLLVSMFGC